MNTIAARARTTLVTGIAAAALTAGLGLGGAGIAEAAPTHGLTCITNLKGTMNVFDHNRLVATQGVSVPAGHSTCLDANEGFESFPISKRSTPDGTIGGASDLQLLHLNTQTGAMDVTLGDEVWGPGGGAPAPGGGHYQTKVYPTMSVGQGSYRMVAVADDGAGHVNRTDITFQTIVY